VVDWAVCLLLFVAALVAAWLTMGDVIWLGLHCLHSLSQRLNNANRVHRINDTTRHQPTQVAVSDTVVG
jgi:hypothetical protein